MQKKNVITLGLISTLACGGILLSTMLGSGVSLAKAATNSECVYVETTTTHDSSAYGFSSKNTCDLDSSEDISNVCDINGLTIGTDITLTGFSPTGAHAPSGRTDHTKAPFKFGKGSGSFSINLTGYTCSHVTIYAAGWPGDTQGEGLSVNSSQKQKVATTESGTTSLNPTAYQFPVNNQNVLTISCTLNNSQRVLVTKIGMRVTKTQS